MAELKIELADNLTPKTCSKLVIHLIKYLLYQAEQIPMTYDSLDRVLKKSKANFDALLGENGQESLGSYRKIKALRFYKMIESLITKCESIFHCIELEFIESGGVEEIVIIIGATTVLPRKLFRIVIPTLSHNECDNDHPPARNLQSLCKHVITSEDLYQYLRDKTEPSNVYIFLKINSNYSPSSNCFLLKEDFRISKVGKHMTVYLKTPNGVIAPVDKCDAISENVPLPNGCKFENENASSDRDENVSLPTGCKFENEKACSDRDNFSWYQSKECLKGLKGFLENGGVSMFSSLLNVKS